MGLIVDVFRTGMQDCTNNGISRRADRLFLVNVDGPFNPGGLDIAAMLVPGNVKGTVKVVPAVWCDIGEWAPDPRWSMMGGNYAATSDSRFHEAVRKITGGASYGAVPIHDRIEN